MDIILHNSSMISPQNQEIFKNRAFIDEFYKSTQIRNRVMHSRPLEYSDLQDLRDLCGKIFRLDKKHISFANLWEVSTSIQRDPGISLRYSLPECDIDESSIQNNLPLPDFDDTGYIGRAKLVDQIVNLCKGAYPVISILGDGGIGKTALALKVAYKLVDDPSHPFDAVIWTSSKTTKLNLYELQEIDGAIRTSLDLFNSISDSLSYKTDNPFHNIIEYLSLFKILLIIDNLETIIDTNISDFLEKLPVGSKVLITSRIGLGRFEYPIFVEPLNMADSIKLLRNYSKNRGINMLYKANQELLSDYCTKMNSNPGYIKWFVAAVGTGKSPESILANPKVFLDFCMSNVYEYLSEFSRIVINSCLSANKELNLAEIAYISELNPDILLTSIQQLVATNMVVMNNYDGETRYGITEFARKYLVKAHPVAAHLLRKYRSRINQINSNNDLDSGIKNRYLFDTIILRNEHDNVIAGKLKQALTATRKKNIEKANSIIEEAILLSPEYFEVHRIDAFIKSLQASSSEAEIAYKAAINLAPNQPHLYYHLGCFTQKYLGDSKTALKYFKKAVELDQNAFDPKYEVARMLLFTGSFNEIFPIIDTLKKALLNSKQEILLMYLNMQIEYRMADQNNQKNEFESCLSHMEQFFSLFTKISQLDRTVGMKKLIRKSSGIVHSLAINSTTFEQKDRANKIMRDWVVLSGLDRFYQHAQVNRLFDENSGFMILDTNEELYFRKEWFIEDVSGRINVGDDFLVIKNKDSQDRVSARYIK
jgi:Tfp pilus assembly protein PilF